MTGTVQIKQMLKYYFLKFTGFKLQNTMTFFFCHVTDNLGAVKAE